MKNANAFFQRICTGELEAVATCLQNSPTLLPARDEGAPPPHLAAINHYRNIADLLLANGADFEAIDDEYGLTPLGWANEKAMSRWPVKGAAPKASKAVLRSSKFCNLKQPHGRIDPQYPLSI
jgi:hypothetical protein